MENKMIRKIFLLQFMLLILSGTLSRIYAQAPWKTDTAWFKPYTDTIPGTKVVFQLTPIPGGTFIMGGNEDDPMAEEDEFPAVEAQLDPFWMGTYEVTFDMYEIFRDVDKDSDAARENEEYNVEAVTRPSPPYEDPTFGMGKYGYPAVSMTQYAALLFCKWLSDKTGNLYRLPTEAEWEYACKSGTNTAYHFGDEVDMLDEYAWYYENSDGGYHKVGTKKPNQWGLYDMHGNVSEWTLGQYQKDYYVSMGDAVALNPWSRPDRLHPRTVKGGSWDDDPEELRCSNRIESDMDWKKRDPQLPKSIWWNTDSPFVGFRIVRPAKQMTEKEIDEYWANILGQ